MLEVYIRLAMNLDIHWDMNCIFEEDSFTYDHTLLIMVSNSFFQSYASILYLRLPSHFRIILRGKDVEHHNIVNDMMTTKVVTYRPVNLPEGMPKDSNVMSWRLNLGNRFILSSNYQCPDISLLSTDGCQSDSWVCEGCTLSYWCTRVQCLS